MEHPVRRGDIWMVELKGEGKMLRGLHPCVITSNYLCLVNSPLIQIVPISSSSSPKPFHVAIEGCGLNSKSSILIEQITTINKTALKYQIGKINLEKIDEIDKKISAQLGIRNNYSLDMFQEIKSMLDEIQELDRYLNDEYNDEIFAERESLLKDLERYCINHSIAIDLHKFNSKYSLRNAGEVNVRAV